MARTGVKIKIPTGSTTPSLGANGLDVYELGFNTTDKTLNINDNGTLRQLGKATTPGVTRTQVYTFPINGQITLGICPALILPAPFKIVKTGIVYFGGTSTTITYKILVYSRDAQNKFLTVDTTLGPNSIAVRQSFVPITRSSEHTTAAYYAIVPEVTGVEGQALDATIYVEVEHYA